MQDFISKTFDYEIAKPAIHIQLYISKKKLKYVLLVQTAVQFVDDFHPLQPNHIQFSYFRFTGTSRIYTSGRFWALFVIRYCPPVALGMTRDRLPRSSFAQPPKSVLRPAKWFPFRPGSYR